MAQSEVLGEIVDDPGSYGLDPDNVLPRRIERWAGTEPDRRAVDEVDGRSVSYSELHDESLRWVRVLKEKGVDAGDRVATFLPSSIDAFAVWLAIARLGAYEIPVNPELRGEFLRHVLDDGDVRLCVARPEFAGLVATVDRADVEVIVAERNVSYAAQKAPALAGKAPEPDDVSCVIYTSGTTGPAKGVVIPWAQMSTIIGRLPRTWLSPDDAVYAPWPTFHVTGRSPLISMADIGGRVVTREKFSLKDFWSDVRRYQCTSTTVGAATGLLLGLPPADDDLDNPLRVVLFGKAGAQAWRFLERFGAVGTTFYGSTEMGFPIACRPITEDVVDVLGWPRPGYEVRVVDDVGADVADGVIGELWIRPPDRSLIMKGYLGRPDLTERAVVDGWYRTGDAVVRHADGSFTFADRIKDTIRRFGENISSAALETEILRDPVITECAVIGVDSDVAGHDILVAVVPVDDTFDAEGFYDSLVERLPRYMLPSFVEVRAEMPRTPNGKVRKSDLRGAVDRSAVWVTPTGERSTPGPVRSTDR